MMSPYPTTPSPPSRTRSHPGLSSVLRSQERISAASRRRASPNAATNSSATRCASSARNSRSAGIELLLEHHPSEDRLHPRTLVELERAHVSVRIDAETDAAFTSLPEAAERVGQQRVADPAAAPRPACEQRRHPAAAVEAVDVDRARDDPIAVAHDAPERRVELLALDVALAPRLER